MHKMNVFQWHLTDDQGWRIEIKKYPRLTEVGAWRVDREDKPWNARPPQGEGEAATYGGFYTQDEVREIVAYAAARGITVVPEIEMPGHCQSALAAYPQFSCTGGPFTVLPGGVGPLRTSGQGMRDVRLQGRAGRGHPLFPRLIHIGGDEVERRWKNAPSPARMAAEAEDRGVQIGSSSASSNINSKEKLLVGRDPRAA
jgi:hexosaminidase